MSSPVYFLICFTYGIKYTLLFTFADALKYTVRRRTNPKTLKMNGVMIIKLNIITILSYLIKYKISVWCKTKKVFHLNDWMTHYCYFCCYYTFIAYFCLTFIEFISMCIQIFMPLHSIHSVYNVRKNVTDKKPDFIKTDIILKHIWAAEWLCLKHGAVGSLFEWRNPGEELQPDCAQGAVKHRGGNIFVFLYFLTSFLFCYIDFVDGIITEAFFLYKPAGVCKATAQTIMIRNSPAAFYK